jgi:hypothetical protein
VVPIVGSVLDNTVLERLNEADLLFGCVDKDYPRMLLCKYAHQHTVPYIDVGAEIGGDLEGIVSTDARVNYVAPGRSCLRCTGLVTPRRLAFESLTGAERKRKVALGYCDDLLINQAAVMDLNMRAASAGVMLLRHLLQPFLRRRSGQPEITMTNAMSAKRIVSPDTVIAARRWGSSLKLHRRSVNRKRNHRRHPLVAIDDHDGKCMHIVVDYLYEVPFSKS